MYREHKLVDCFKKNVYAIGGKYGNLYMDNIW